MRRYQLKYASPNNSTPASTNLTSNTLSPARQALSHPDFARYAYGRFAATLAWQMIDVVLGYQVWQLTHSKAYLGYIGLAQFLPFVVLLLPGGQIADRFDRRLIIALAYGLELVAAAALLMFTLTGQSEVILLFFIAALLGVGRSFWAPDGTGHGSQPRAQGVAVRRHLLQHAAVHHRHHRRSGVARLTLILGIDWSYGIAVALLIAAMFLIAV
jgi:MFS family permease